jgi:hypothetical protein
LLADAHIPVCILNACQSAKQDTGTIYKGSKKQVVITVMIKH